MFSYGVSELRQASEAEAREPRRASGAPTLRLAAFKPAKQALGFDPYNSGGFDRKQSWARIRKR